MRALGGLALGALFLSGCQRGPQPAVEPIKQPPAAGQSHDALSGINAGPADVGGNELLAAASEPPSLEAAPIAPVGRVLVLAPVGPLLIDLMITVDGRSLADARRQAADELIARIAAESDGGLPWEEALKDSRFSLGEAPRTRQDRAILIASVDSNRDRLVDADEAVEFFARLDSIGPALALDVAASSWSEASKSRLWRLADANRDGALAADELSNLSDRLRAYDANGDDLIDAAEIERGALAAGYGMGSTRESSAIEPRMAMLCDAPFRGDSIPYLIEQLYPQASSATSDRQTPFSTVPALIRALDANGNGRLDRNEPRRLAEIEPHARLRIAFGRGHPQALPLEIEWLDGELAGLASSVEDADQLQCDLWGDRMLVTRRLRPRGGSAAGSPLLAGFDALDRDANGYLDSDELPEGDMALSRAFAAADLEGDGRLYRAEIASFLDWQQGLREMSARLRISSQADPLFAALDTSGDGRLSLRELRAAPNLIEHHDANGDGRLTIDELPVVIRLDFQGPAAGGEEMADADGDDGSDASASAEEPDINWFRRMDLNGDGDLTPSEFLGTREQFNRLDRNGDGFIDAEEVRTTGDKER